jgi:hypothetical protein
MKKAFSFTLSMMVMLFMLCSCGGGSGGGGAKPDSTTGKAVGKVSNNATGAAIPNATVTDGTASTTTASDGTFTLDNLAPATAKVLTITASNFAFASRILNVVADGTSRVDVAMLPVAASLNIASLTTGTTLNVPNSPAQVQLPANSLVTSSNGAPTFPVTANLTPVDPSGNPQLMPGNFTTSTGEQIESFGAMGISFTDSTGAPLNLASGQTATIRIPVSAASQGTAAATMPAFYYNSTTGKWEQEGTLTLGGTKPDQYYEGTVTTFGYWNADQVYDTACITGKVVDASDNLVTNARVEAEGRDYTGTSTAYTAAGGTFTIQVKANSTVILTASTSNALSNSEVVTSGGAGSACTELQTDLKLGAIFGSLGSGSAKIKLTWGDNPSDLDSHLTGPDPTTPGTLFHVYFVDEGDLAAAPYAALDVDDVTGFGPEIITISKFTAGTYRYSVHHYSGTGDFITSPARVELTLNGATTIFTPPAAGSTVLGEDSEWQVFELNVDANGNATVNTLNTYSSSEPGDTYSVTASALRGVTKKSAFPTWDY